MSKQPLHLNFVIRAHGSHEGGWRLTKTAPQDLTSTNYYAKLVKTAERGLFDTVFLTDTLKQSENPTEALQWPLDPLLLMGALSVETDHIGLIATHSTTFNAPFNTARLFASLDHLSNGRAGWNIVTSTGDDTARNFGDKQIVSHDDRYRRAQDYIDAVLALWHAWDDDAVTGDKEAGWLVREAAIHAVNYQGEFYATQGPLNTPATPQRVPLLSQAGASGPGRDLAARYADVVYAFHNGLDDAHAYRQDLRQRASALGRNPDELRLLPGIVPYLASTAAEARQLRNELFELGNPDGQLANASQLFGIELEKKHLDAPVDWERIKERKEHWGEREKVERILQARETRSAYSTLRDLLLDLDFRFQHRSLVGTPEDIADYIEQGYRGEAFDGVSIIPPYLPEGLDIFVDTVVPILQARGLHKTTYGAGPLRQRLGLRQWTVDRSAFTKHYK